MGTPSGSGDASSPSNPPDLPQTNEPSTTETTIPSPTRAPTTGQDPPPDPPTDCLTLTSVRDLQAAIQVANDGDTLTFCSGTTLDFQTGDPDLLLEQTTLDFACARQTNNSNNDDGCTWNGTNSKRFMTLINAESTFTGFIFENGFSTGDAGAFGILRTSTVNFVDCIFRSNQAQNGGALFIVDSTVNFESSSTATTDESSSGECLFENNQAPNSNGGTLFVERSTLSFKGCTVSGSVAYSGGAIVAIDSYISVQDTTFRDNFAGGCGEGPAVFIGSTSFPSPENEILECVGDNNQFINNTDSDFCQGTADIAGPSKNCEAFESFGYILGDAEDAFSGYSIDISHFGHRVVVGADEGNFVTLYERNGMMYTQVGNRIFGDEEGDYFGSQVQFDEDYNSGDARSTIAVSAQGGPRGYYVKVFDIDTSLGDDWIQRGSTLYAGPGYQGTPFSMGFKTLGGNYVAVGNRVYLWDGDSWEQYGQDLEDVGSIAVSQDGLQVAAADAAAEVVSIYRKSGDVWELQTEIATGLGVFQVDFAQNSTILGVGFGPDETTAGRVQVYLRSINPADGSFVWDQIGSDLTVASTEMAYTTISMDISSCSPYSSFRRCIHVAIGSPSSEGSGFVRVYKMSYEEEDDWTQLAEEIVLPGGGTVGDDFGRSVAISWQAGVVAVGAIGVEDANQERNTGAVYVFNQLAGIF
jgi:hypothetical protein